MQSLELTAFCRVLPTESTEKIVRALKKVFGESILIRADDEKVMVEGDEKAVNAFLNVIGREKIAARTYFLFKHRRKGDTISFPLERDPLTVGKISFGEDSAVPPVWVEIRGDVDEVLERLRNLAELD
jgi:predicted RNA binding protein with dsRBD fold (UPF0201 family)